MRPNGHGLVLNMEHKSNPAVLPLLTPPNPGSVVEWDWDIEHADRKRETDADAALHHSTPFQVDRKVLKDVVREKMGSDVGRIKFLSAGTFHKAYLVVLVHGAELVARVARRYMPRLKTESEVATIEYLRENTTVPVPFVYHYDSNPYNRLGGEYILMSKAPGIQLAKVYHSMSYTEIADLLENLAAMMIPLFARRFSHIGSLYFGHGSVTSMSSSVATPKANHFYHSAFPFSPSLSMSTNEMTPKVSSVNPSKIATQDFHVGPIVSWPFFGSNRGQLSHPNEIERGPWPTVKSYLASCADREIKGVIREIEDKSAPHRLHLDPDQIHTSRHHHVKAIPGDESDESDDWGLEESDEEWEGPGDAMYRDYRRMQRCTFLVAHISRREECVRQEMRRWVNLMERLVQAVAKENEDIEEFGLDCHDLSLENVFVDTEQHSKITCVIDWESTTTRPLWACASLPAFLQSSPFTANIFREAISKIARVNSASETPRTTKEVNLAVSAREWLHYESVGVRLRMAHRCLEWDGWEEGLVDSILGPEESEDDWFKDWETDGGAEYLSSPPAPETNGNVNGDDGVEASGTFISSFTRRKPASKLPFVKEKEKEKMLNETGDICGGRGGELGRRLEAWLTTNRNENLVVPDDSREYEAEAG